LPSISLLQVLFKRAFSSAHFTLTHISSVKTT